MGAPPQWGLESHSTFTEETKRKTHPIIPDLGLGSDGRMKLAPTPPTSVQHAFRAWAGWGHRLGARLIQRSRDHGTLKDIRPASVRESFSGNGGQRLADPQWLSRIWLPIHLALRARDTGLGARPARCGFP